MKNIILIKCGGSLLESLSDSFYEGIKSLKDNGYQPVIVHGGGPAINEMLEALQIESEFIDGLRKTTPAVMNVAEMVLSGSTTNSIVRRLNKRGLSAVGLTGFDGELLQAKAKDFDRLGLVGEITHVNTSFLNNILSLGLTPVISPLAVGIDGIESYNVNADTAAGAIATALGAIKLLFVTDVPGVLEDERLLEKATETEIHKLIANGTITGGMVPKVLAAIECLHAGMSEIMIVSGKTDLVKDEKIIGTVITKDVEAVHSYEKRI